jgi:hypothetical protein
MTEFLLEHGADRNIDESPMEHAILSSWPELVQLLVRYVYVVTLSLSFRPNSLLRLLQIRR